MKPIKIISTTALFLMFGIAPTVEARQEKQEEKAKPAQQEQQAKPEKQQQAKGQQQPQHQQQQSKGQEQPQQHQQQQPKGQQQSQQHQQAKGQEQPQQHQQQQAKGQQQPQQHQQQQSGSSHPPQRTQEAMVRQREQPALHLSARGGGRIPDERFHSNFGHDHHFRVGNPVMVGGYSRFQYGGYWFGFVQPWPVGWYYTDDVYIDYVDGGYYMYNPYYPGARFSISVVI
jgi:hypothetical protein